MSGFLFLYQSILAILNAYDVVIVGAGPAGMRCAEKLSDSNLSVLLLEKNNEPGHKICAGGITRKGIELLNIPDDIIEHKVNSFTLHSPHYKHARIWPETIAVTVNRMTFGHWQLERLRRTKVHYRKNAKVTSVNSGCVIINGKDEIKFKYLVGTDGPLSIVRKHLHIPVVKVLTAIQYIIPMENVKPQLEIYLDSKFFHSWYAWLFPHKSSIAVGACCNAKWLSGKELKHNLNEWLSRNNFDISNATYQSNPISYDYRGLKFGNIFLAGEAAGMASGLTGEGIYQSIVSGEIVARMIKGNEDYHELLADILRYNNYQHQFMRVSQKAGFLRNILFDSIILLMKSKYINKRITEGFS